MLLSAASDWAQRVLTRRNRKAGGVRCGQWLVRPSRVRSWRGLQTRFQQRPGLAVHRGTGGCNAPVRFSEPVQRGSLPWNLELETRSAVSKRAAVDSWVREKLELPGRGQSFGRDSEDALVFYIPPFFSSPVPQLNLKTHATSVLHCLIFALFFFQYFTLQDDPYTAVAVA